MMVLLPERIQEKFETIINLYLKPLFYINVIMYLFILRLLKRVYCLTLPWNTYNQSFN